MATLSFGASVSDWAKKTPERLQATRNAAIDLLAEEMTKTKADGGRMPFLTGTLARSLVASTSGMPGAGGDPVGTVTATLALNQAVWLGFPLVYARRVNSGFVGEDSKGRSYDQKGALFVEGAIAEWQNLVRKAAREVQQDSA